MVSSDSAGDAYQIGCSTLDDLLCGFWLCDAAGTDDVTVHGCRDSLGKGPVICFARELGGTTSADARRQVEDGDARVVKRTCGFDTLRQQAPALRRCPAVRVGAVVGQRAEKLPQQVAMCTVDLDEIVAGSLDACSCSSKGANGRDDVVLGHLLRDQV